MTQTGREGESAGKMVDIILHDKEENTVWLGLVLRLQNNLFTRLH